MVVSEYREQFAHSACHSVCLHFEVGFVHVVRYQFYATMARVSDKIIKLLMSRAGLLDRVQVNTVCDCLNGGGVVAIPTDTIYGLAARVDDSKSLKKIYQIKGRDASKPLAICLPHIDSISEVAQVQDINPRIISCLLPGPITILLKRSQNLNPDLNPGVDTVGIRVIDNEFVVVVTTLVGPLALTSANRSGGMNPTIISDFIELHPEIDLIVDASQTQKDVVGDISRPNHKLGSTVIDLTRKNYYSIVREGCAFNRSIAILNRFGLKEHKKG